MTDLAKSLVDAAAEALREMGFVDPDDDTVPTFFSQTDPMGNPDGGRIDVWKPVEDAARVAVGAAVEAIADWLKTKDPNTEVQLDRLVAAVRDGRSDG